MSNCAISKANDQSYVSHGVMLLIKTDVAEIAFLPLADFIKLTIYLNTIRQNWTGAEAVCKSSTISTHFSFLF